ncbi:MAG TPA: YraN family protein [Methylophilaceae bacterium]
MSNRGTEAESAAAEYLQQKGLKLLERNHVSRYGEIDLIMQDGKTLVFVEVRLRSSSGFGGAAMSITPVKQKRIMRTAEQYLQRHGNHACRFDVVLMSRADGSDIEWIRNAFDAN